VGFPESWKSATFFFFSDGGLGVCCCCFIISGFLSTTLLLREKWKTGRIHLPSFYLRRTRRNFPVYFIALGFNAPVENFSAYNQSAQNRYYLMTFTNNYTPLCLAHWTALPPL